MNKVILYVAASLDGFIADINGKVDWLWMPNDPDDILGYRKLKNRIGTIVMGSKSYQQALTFGPWEWSDKHTYVFTSKPLRTDLTCVEFISQSPQEFIENFRRAGKSKDIWLFGGAALAASFAQVRLIDEIVLTSVPITLGDGILLNLPWHDFMLQSEIQCMEGLIQKTYFLN
ncbi:unnamed protein product [Blepharisma stoltei]|uniref:Bacterial bifunctional deaminase-reductase C-terminal domain-containing protein n=1 Tax=Blepharisma stoltei TaxID=1481888 RepID=A0AAU9JTA3_9CILI|nr:unnamed protein product [Blepharisma stoltei]